MTPRDLAKILFELGDLTGKMKTEAETTRSVEVEGVKYVSVRLSTANDLLLAAERWQVTLSTLLNGDEFKTIGNPVWSPAEILAYDHGAASWMSGIESSAAPDLHGRRWLEGWADSKDERPGSRGAAIRRSICTGTNPRDDLEALLNKTSPINPGNPISVYPD